MVSIFTRKAEEVSTSLPEIVEEIKTNPHSFIVDCEIIPFEHSSKAFQEALDLGFEGLMIKKRYLCNNPSSLMWYHEIRK